MELPLVGWLKCYWIELNRTELTWTGAVLLLLVLMDGLAYALPFSAFIVYIIYYWGYLGCLLCGVYVPCIYRMPGGVMVGDSGLCCCGPAFNVWCQLFKRNYFPLFALFCFLLSPWYYLHGWLGVKSQLSIYISICLFSFNFCLFVRDSNPRRSFSVAASDGGHGLESEPLFDPRPSVDVEMVTTTAVPAGEDGYETGATDSITSTPKQARPWLHHPLTLTLTTPRPVLMRAQVVGTVLTTLPQMTRDRQNWHCDDYPMLSF